MKKILFVIDKLELKYFEFNDLITNFWLIKEFLELNQKVFITTIDKLSLKYSKPFSNCAEAYLKEDNIFYKNKFEEKEVDSFDIVMFRPDPPVDLNYINATYILDFVNPEKTLIINNSKAIRDFNEKLHANLFYEFMPENIATSNQIEIKEFLKKNKEIILKPLNNCFGGGVFYLKENDKNISSVIKTMTADGQNIIMVQKYINKAKYGDKRVLTLGDKVLDCCVQKLPPKDDFKFNTHSDEFIKKAVLTKTEKQNFEKIAKKLNKMGIFMAGFDVIDGKIIEINVTSPCYFIKEINNYFSTNLEKQIADYILGKL